MCVERMCVGIIALLFTLVLRDMVERMCVKVMDALLLWPCGTW